MFSRNGSLLSLRAISSIDKNVWRHEPVDKKSDTIIVCGVSGAGKSFLINSSIKNFLHLKKLSTITTRPKRNIEAAGSSIVFLSNSEFENKQKSGDLVIVNSVFGYKYAFDMREYREYIQKGYHVILELKFEDLHQASSVFSNFFAIYVYPSYIQYDFIVCSTRNNCEERKKDIEDELQQIRGKCAPNIGLINVLFTNHYDDASIECFISIIGKVIG